MLLLVAAMVRAVAAIVVFRLKQVVKFEEEPREQVLLKLVMSYFLLLKLLKIMKVLGGACFAYDMFILFKFI